ncbi:MAG: hypothetical protein GKR87_16070 [Kiritimatiellae bacterium]|nr:hypothetical protein [Kiritimatiellia bacterium]
MTEKEIFFHIPQKPGRINMRLAYVPGVDSKPPNNSEVQKIIQPVKFSKNAKPVLAVTKSAPRNMAIEKIGSKQRMVSFQEGQTQIGTREPIGTRQALEKSKASFIYPETCIEEGCEGRIRLRIEIKDSGNIGPVEAAESNVYCAHLKSTCIAQTSNILVQYVLHADSSHENIMPGVSLYDVVWELVD